MTADACVVSNSRTYLALDRKLTCPLCASSSVLTAEMARFGSPPAISAPISEASCFSVRVTVTQRYRNLGNRQAGRRQGGAVAAIDESFSSRWTQIQGQPRR